MLRMRPLWALALAAVLAGGCRSNRNVEAGRPGATSMSPTLAQAVQTNIGNTQGVDARNVHVDAFGDQVILSGTVPNDQDRQRVLQAAQQTSGVKNVYDRIMVGQMAQPGTQPKTSTEQMRQRMGSAEGSNVHMMVQNGTMTLTGRVPSEAMKQQAGQIALQTPGVTRVENKLTVQP